MGTAFQAEGTAWPEWDMEDMWLIYVAEEGSLESDVLYV